ncbi:DUF5753 domain-containing protein [Streptomyces sp. XM4011]|uniref:Scr1 family TA system antitoxin-like transcriptional regulator n=1 Tax=Streptomyces sp. XM4011 TaxID=2929780 RepID=UPI001FF8092A|nr:Scr1 family TA system antitoxin-like transcriptional regulator [Streptomyces sp. XM4011]MCK1812769.1 DUF5753 domain-containing protein [Streptomyces sp. XM4011]
MIAVARAMLGRRLRELRLDRGLTLADAARWWPATASTLSRVERGEAPLRREAVRALVQGYELSVDEDYDVECLLLAAMRTAESGDRWTDDGPGRWERLFTLTQWATRATEYATFLVPARARVPAYSQAREDTPESQLVDAVQLGTCLPVSLVIEEDVLRRPVGGPAVMVQQLEHLLPLCTVRGDLTVRIVPQGTPTRVHAKSTFVLLEFGSGFPGFPIVWQEFGPYITYRSGRATAIARRAISGAAGAEHSATRIRGAIEDLRARHP